MKNWQLITLAAILATLLLGSCSQLKKLPIVSGYAAKKVCSCTFVAERSQQSIEDEDLSLTVLQLATNSIDYEQRSVTSKVFGLMGAKTAVYREKLGCVLLNGKDDYGITYPKGSTASAVADTVFPYGELLPDSKPSGVDYAKLDEAVSAWFDPSRGMDSLNTRAVLVIYKDTIVAEQYANGIDKDTEILGWSMTKSIMNAWVGMLVADGKITVQDNGLLPEWTDERKGITLEHLLQMSSGLEWEENYTKVSGATTMLFDAEDAVATAAAAPLAHTPGSTWLYSSGTTNLISGYLRQQYPMHGDYLRYPHERIFGPLGMTSTVMEIDETGNYIGSSYCYATARDWARFGLLYLHDGVWKGERLLPAGWVDYTTTLVPDSEGMYGAHFWLNIDGAAMPDVPHDAYSCNGYQGQRVIIIPSKELVIVRLGLSENLDFNTFVGNIAASIR